MRVAIFVALLAGPALAADQVPPDAYRYRHELIGNARAIWGIDAPVPVFAAQIHQESWWRADARSPVGAAGLAQFTPATARWISGAYPALAANAPYSPAWALRALVQYDRILWDRVAVFETDCDRMAFALSGYNGGEGWRRRRQARSPQPGRYLVTEYINPGISPAGQAENQSYAPSVLRRWQPLYGSWGSVVRCEGVL